MYSALIGLFANHHLKWWLLTSIDIKNFRQHKNLHLDFPKNKETDLHVIVASNGVGKTNLMNAIVWCFYGIEPNIDKSAKAALPLCNMKALEEARENGESIAVVSVEIRVTANGESIVFSRTANVNVATRFTQKPVFEVQVTNITGDTEFLHDDYAIERVNMYVPLKIRQYFFFDGEQLHNYFGPTQDTTHVKDSIYEIAQINIITAAKEHLGKLIAEYKNHIAKTNPQLQVISNQLATKRIDLENRKNDIIELENSNREATLRIGQLDTLISGSETVPSDTKKLKENETRMAELEREVENLNGQLLKLVRKYYIILAMYRINMRTNSYISDKE